MKHLAVLLIFVAFSFQSSANESPLVEAFGSLPDVKQMKISPKGDQLAYLQFTKNGYALVVQNLAKAGTKPIVFGINEGQIHTLRWLNNERVYFSISVPYFAEQQRMWHTLYRNSILNTQTGDAIFPFKSRRYQYNIDPMELEHVLPEDPVHILVSNHYRDNFYSPRRKGLFKLNINDGTTDLVDSAYMRQRPDLKWFDGISWIFSPKGEVIGKQQYDDNNDRIDTFLLSEEGKLAQVLHNENGAIDLERIIAIQGDLAFIPQTDERGVTSLYANAVSDLQAAPKVQANIDGYDIDYVMYDLHTSELTGVTYTDDFYRTDYAFDKELSAIQASLNATFENAQVYILSYTKDRSTFTVRVSGGEFLPTYYLYDHAGKQLSFLGEEYPSVDPISVGTTISFDFEASDGLTIPGYLSLPVKSESLPELLVLPHGGPHSRDDADFDWLRDFYVANGYAVYQPNFRGSSGYGNAFEDRGRGQWGRRMQQDVYEGTQAVLASGRVNDKKPCILGASYGGYVAMMAATEAQSLYRCAVSFAGVSNIDHKITVDTLGSSRESGFNKQRYAQFYFDGEATKEDLASISPHLLASKDTLPLALFHGKQDTVVRYKHSENMHANLQAKGNKDSVLLGFPGSDHWLSDEDIRKIFLSDSLYFIQTR